VARVLSLCAGVLLGVLAGHARAVAQPAVRLAVAGDCPSADELSRALGGQVRAAADGEAAWTIEVEPAPPRAGLRLRAPDGALALERAIASEDCRALAQAFALIVIAQFAELQLLVAPSAPAPTPTPAAPPISRDAPEHEQEHEHEHEHEREHEREPAVPLALDVALLGGAELGIAPFAAAPAAGLALGLGPEPRAGGWLARLDLRVAAPVQHESASDRVERWGGALRAELGGRLPLGFGAWLAATAGGGVTLAHVTALDLAGEPGALRIWPALSLSALGGLALGARWSLRLQASASVYPRTDRYVIDPEGVVAKSPRAELAAGLGLQFESPL
jgi:hypothetical protein